MNLEDKILESFKKKMGKEVENLDLIVCLDYNDDEFNGSVMEKQDNGKVWGIEYTKSGNIKDIFEI